MGDDNFASNSDARLPFSRRRALWWDAAVQDVRFALRGVRLRPGYNLLVTLSLALGLAFSTAAFAVVKKYRLQAVPFPSPSRLVVVEDETPTREETVARLEWLRRESRTIEVGAFGGGVEWITTAATGVIPGRALFLSDGLLSLLGVR